MASHLDILWSATRSALSSSARLVLMVVAARARGTRESCDYGQATLAGLTGLSERTIRSCVAELRAGGWITTVYGRGKQAVHSCCDPATVAGSNGGDPATPPATVACLTHLMAENQINNNKERENMENSHQGNNPTPPHQNATVTGTTPSRFDELSLARLLQLEREANPEDIPSPNRDRFTLGVLKRRILDGWDEAKLTAWFAACRRKGVSSLKWQTILGPSDFIAAKREAWEEENAPTVVDEAPAISRREQARLSAIAADVAWKKEREERLADRAARKAAK